MANSDDRLDIEAFWEYGDPEASEARYRDALEEAAGDERLELLTQVARTYGVRGQFAEAHQILDDVEKQLKRAGPRPRVRYLLERGRTFNSNGDIAQARELFFEAWNQSRFGDLEGLAVDAAHMVAITFSGKREAIEWNLRGLEIARQSEAPKARALIPAMLNNSAWDLHDMGRYAEALPLFEEARDEWVAHGQTSQIQIARWSLARCLRSLERYEEALEIQRDLEVEHAEAGTVDGYVFEEIAENLAAEGDTQAAKAYYSKAYEVLSKDAWFVENEAGRLERLKSFAGE